MLQNPGWLFAIATAIACVGITIVFRNLMNRLTDIIGAENEMKVVERETLSFFIKVAIIEVVPIILLVLGILKMKGFTGTIDEMIIPLIITVLIYLFSLVVIFLSAKQVQSLANISNMLKGQVSTFMMMGISITSTFPLIAFVMIFLAR